MNSSSMSGRAEKGSLEQALKEVFYIHRNTVKEYQSEIGQWIERYEALEKEKSKLSDEVENLEKRNVKLIEERAVLNQTMDQTKRRSNDNCTMCEHLKQSMKVVQDAYKQTLEEKDNMIQFLKEQLAEKSGNRPLSDLSNKSQSRASTLKTPDKTNNIVDKKSGESLKKKHSPDSTVDASKTGTGKAKANVATELESSNTEQKNEKLRLTRKSKRVKYKEDISPTNKKLKYSPSLVNKEESGSSSENTSPDKETTKKSGSILSSSSNVTNSRGKSEVLNKRGTGNNSVMEHKSNDDKFLVPETCLDQNVSMSDEDLIDGDDHGTRNLVVPETLGMGAYSSCSEEEDLDQDTMRANTQIQQPTIQSRSLLKNTKDKTRTSMSRSRNIMNDTTNILNSPNSEASDVNEDMGRFHPKLDVSLTKHDEEKIDPDETSESGYASRIEKSFQKFDSGSEGDSHSNNDSNQNKESQKSISKKKQREIHLCKPTKTNDLSVDVECDGEDSAFPLSPVFTKPVSKNGVSKTKQVTNQVSENDECFDDPASPLLLQRGKTYKPKDKKENVSALRSKRNVKNLAENSKSEKVHPSKQEVVKKSSQESNRSTRTKKKMARNSRTDAADDTMKQTTLSQAFTSSPILSAPPVQSESEKEKIEEAIRRSLLDFQKETKKRSEKENVFKIPLSPKSTTPCKRRPSSNKKSPAKTPERRIEQLDPDETVAPSPDTFTSQPLIPLRRSPRKSPRKVAIDSRASLSSEQSVNDLDETVAPSPNLLMGDKSLPDDDGNESQVLNRSIAPDVRLTQYCQDSEVDPLKASPTLKKENRNARKRIDLTSNEESQNLPCSSKSFKFGGRKKRAQSIETQQEDVLEEDEEDAGTLKDEEEEMEDEKFDHDEHTSFDSSFDRVDKKKGIDYAHVKVVKKQDERRKLKGHSCKECYEYYKSTGMSEAEIQSRIQDCSRHRAEYIPPDTPEHYWSIGFPDTQECHERGYAQIERNTKPSNFRRRRQLQKQFKSKAEDNEEDGQDDLIFK